jgi:competence protein ComEA
MLRISKSIVFGEPRVHPAWEDDMRIKSIELVIIALTLAFACFLGGYFIGRRSAVNIITVEPRAEMPRAGGSAPAVIAPDLPEASAAAGILPDNPGGGLTQPGGTEFADAPGGEPQWQAPEIVGAPRGGDGRININTATRGELMDLTGVGDVIAGRIIDYRDRHGGFSRIEDIMNVSGIGEKRFEAIKDNITVG